MGFACPPAPHVNTHLVKSAQLTLAIRAIYKCIYVYISSPTLPSLHRPAKKSYDTYTCPLCEWSGQRSWGIQHYTVVHGDMNIAPFCCTACGFKTGLKAKMDIHLASEAHARRLGRMDPALGPQVFMRSSDPIVKKLLLLSKESTKRLPRNQHLAEDLDTGHGSGGYLSAPNLPPQTIITFWLILILPFHILLIAFHVSFITQHLGSNICRHWG